MKTTIRTTKPEEYTITEFITRETFWNLYAPGCTEHLILHQLRKSTAYVAELDLITEVNNEIVAHIISSKAIVKDRNNQNHDVLCVGPLTVKTNFQNKGIGSLLLKESIEKASTMHFAGMILFGNPAYYQRFGFKDAKHFSICTKDGQNLPPFMALELRENSLSNVNGHFFEAPEFSVNDAVLSEFEKQFPYKEKRVTDTQLKH